MQYALNLSGLASTQLLLGADNVVLVVLLVSHLTPAVRRRVFIAGVLFAAVARLLLGVLLRGLVHTSAPSAWMARQLAFLIGGGFLVAKGIGELAQPLPQLQRPSAAGPTGCACDTRAALIVLGQIVFADTVLSIDAVLSAAAFTHQPMVLAVVIAVSTALLMSLASPLSALIDRAPALRIVSAAAVAGIGASMVAGTTRTPAATGIVLGASAAVWVAHAFVRLLHQATRAPRSSAVVGRVLWEGRP
jgi:predicted tellurium resistance membrane protein TerC